MSKATMLVKEPGHPLHGQRVSVASFRRIGWRKQPKAPGFLDELSMVKNKNNKTSKVVAMKDLTKRARSRGPGLHTPKWSFPFNKTDLRSLIKKRRKKDPSYTRRQAIIDLSMPV